MFTLNQRIEAIILIIITFVAGIYLAFNLNKNKPQSTLASDLPVLKSQPASNPLPTIQPSPIPTYIPQISTISEISSDGTKKVILETKDNNNGTNTLTLTTEDGTGENLRVILNETLDKNSSITIPFNTWSPDNKYFFIQKNTPENTEIKVFTADGQNFNIDEPFLDLTGLFKLRDTGHNYKEATGWGGYGLIVFNTTKQNNDYGPSYWFEVPSKAIIPLSTLFL